MDRLTCVAVEQRVGALAAGAQHILVHVAPDDVLKALGQEAALDNQPLLAVQVSARTQLLCGGDFFPIFFLFFPFFSPCGRTQASGLNAQAGRTTIKWVSSAAGVHVEMPAWRSSASVTRRLPQPQALRTNAMQHGAGDTAVAMPWRRCISNCNVKGVG